MAKKRIVVTGSGVISSIGIGKKQYWRGLQEGRSGVGPITLFKTEPYSVKSAGEASRFEPTAYFNKKELVNFDRATSLIVAAAKMVIGDAGLKITPENADQINISVGTTFGSLQSLSEFDKESVVKGPQLVNPSRFPNTVANLPSSQVSIYFQIKGMNATISTGMCAGLDAIDYAVKAIQLYDRKIVLTGSVEEMCEQTFIGFYRLNMLAGKKDNEPAISCPFDKRRHGIVFGEGATMLMLEDIEYAQKRQASILCEIVSMASNYDPFSFHRYNPKAKGMIRVMQAALWRANLDPQDIDCIFANANSTLQGDLAEAVAIEEVLGKSVGNVPVTSIKSMVGETYSAAGGLAALGAVCAIQDGIVPPTINYKERDPRIHLNIAANKAKRADLRFVMVNAFGQNGMNTSLILKRFEK